MKPPSSGYPPRAQIVDRRLASRIDRLGRYWKSIPLNLFEESGAAAAAVATHAELPDPHPGYLTSAEGNALLQAAWPIGSIFLSTTATDPSTLLGFGTWTAIGAGRMLIGRDPEDTDFDTLGETGGAKTVAAAGSISAPTFTGAPLAGHAHGVGTYAASAHSGTAVAEHAANVTGVNNGGAQAIGAGAPTASAEAHTHTTPALSHSVTQPDNHALTGSSESVSAGTPAGSVSAPTFTPSATSVVQPYLVVALWRRDA